MIQVEKWCNPTKQSEIRYYISGLKGVDTQRNPAIETAKALLRHFGSLSAVFNATCSGLCAADGIGKKTA